MNQVADSSELARDAALPQPTVHRHLNLLETGCLIARLAPYATHPTSGLVKSRKLYWSDCGLDQGFWLEQAIFQSLQTWHALDLTSRRLYFWRDRSGREVDFVLEKNGVLVALEIKAASQVTLADVVGIKAFQQGLGAGQRFRRRRIGPSAR